MKKHLLWALPLAALAACNRPPQTAAPTFSTIAFYNIENLFDTVDDPKTDDAEFLPSGSYSWTPERYQTKLLNMAKVIGQLGDADGPELLGVCEVENRHVMEDLAQTEPLKGRGYAVVHSDSKDARGIDVGLFYKTSAFKLLHQRSYTVAFPDTEFRTRDILLATGIYQNTDTLTVLVNHWPSRRGGEAAAQNRMTVALWAKAISDSVQARFPGRHVLLMGDFNDEPTDKSILEGLQATGNMEEAKTQAKLYNALWQLKAEGKGTYNYNGQWNMLDQILLSRQFMDGKGLEFVLGSAAIFSPEWMHDTGKFAGNPLRTYAGRKYLGGYADHFPIYIQVKTSRVAHKYE